MTKEPILETERLILRPITIEDAEAVFSWTSDWRVSRYMSYPASRDISETISWIQSTFDENAEWIWAFVLKNENRVIGAGSIGEDHYMQGYWGIGYNIHYDWLAQVL